MEAYFVTCGPPFSGKTTVAREVAARTGARYISFDQMQAAYEASEHILGPDMETKEFAWTAAQFAMNDLAAKAVRLGPVVADGVHPVREDRDIQRRRALNNYAVPILIHMNPGRETIIERWQRNRQAPTRNDVSTASLDKLLGIFMQPTPDEEPITLSSEQEVAVWLHDLPGSVEYMKLTRVKSMLEQLLLSHQIPLDEWGYGDAKSTTELAQELISDKFNFTVERIPQRGGSWYVDMVLCKEARTVQIRVVLSGAERHTAVQEIRPADDPEDVAMGLIRAAGINPLGNFVRERPPKKDRYYSREYPGLLCQSVTHTFVVSDSPYLRC